MLTLYYSPRACSTASHLALEEAGADYDVQVINLQDREDYRKINPLGTVPALAVDDVLITENLAILAYIADSHPQAQLLATEPLERARQISLMGWFSSAVHINRRQFKMPVRFTPDPNAQEAIRQGGRDAFWKNLQKIDRLYAGRTWLFDRFGVADCYAFVFYHWGFLDDLPMAELEAYTAFSRRLIERPAARRVLEREDNILLQRASP